MRVRIINVVSVTRLPLLSVGPGSLQNVLVGRQELSCHSRSWENQKTELLSRVTHRLMEATQPRGSASSAGMEPKPFTLGLVWKLLEILPL